MRILLATVVVAGCSFDAGYGPEGTGDPGPVDPMAATDAAISPVSTCKFADSTLRLCIEFADGKVKPTASDSSGYQMNANASDVSMTNRGGDPAASVLPTSNLDVPENAMLDIPDRITFETWLYLTAQPLNYTQFTFMLNENQWGMTVDSEGRLRCWVGSQYAETSTLSNNAWHHIACVYDGEKLKTYVDGSIAKCSDRSGPIPTAGTHGAKLVDLLLGGIDDMRVYASALDGAKICSHANQSQCQSGCD